MTLSEFFSAHPKCALAFSGGVDSAYLLYAALKNGADVVAHFVRSPFQPQFELEDAKKLARELGAKLEILDLDLLSHREIAENPKNRCYFCKRAIFECIWARAQTEGYPVLMDGTNASDDRTDRPGMRALEELSVRSPLRDCGLTKAEVRRLSREAGLFTADKPAYACLATRIPSGTAITQEILTATENAEKFLFSLSFRDFRVRYVDGQAKLQVPEAQLPQVLAHRAEILEALKKGYSSVVLDLEVRP